ncbi:MAG: type II toxin-antitoxin system HicB family antitoxin [Chloroflexi bacterium]|nr:type II toxin-antitoxin system HicB family antitoxin [Chloroflexota bacterium]
MTSVKSEIIFEVSQDEVDGGYSASAVGYGIHTQGETLEEVRANVRDAVECYFDETMERPGLIRLHHTQDLGQHRAYCGAN